MNRCWLKGAIGDALHVLSCAAGYNLRWLMRTVLRFGFKGLLLAFIMVRRVAAPSGRHAVTGPRAAHMAIAA